MTEFVYVGFTVSSLAGLATGTAALPIILVRRITGGILDTPLGFDAGVIWLKQVH